MKARGFAPNHKCNNCIREGGLVLPREGVEGRASVGASCYARSDFGAYDVCVIGKM